MDFICKSAGSIHQGNEQLFPVSYNKQCVANSVCALAWKSIGDFETESINDILHCGDAIYCSLRSGHEQGIYKYLEPDELSGTTVEILCEKIKVVEVTNIHNSLWPENTDDFEEYVFELAKVLEEILLECEDIGYLFTGLCITVSFWQKNGQFYVFDSHAVNEKREFDLINEDNNRARLFECEGFYSLAYLLLKNAPLDGKSKQFSIDQIVLFRYTDMENESESEENLSIPEDYQYIDHSLNQNIEFQENENESERNFAILEDFPYISHSLNQNTEFKNDSVRTNEISPEEKRPRKAKYKRPNTHPPNSENIPDNKRKYSTVFR